MDNKEMVFSKNKRYSKLQQLECALKKYECTLKPGFSIFVREDILKGGTIRDTIIIFVNYQRRIRYDFQEALAELIVELAEFEEMSQTIEKI